MTVREDKGKDSRHPSQITPLTEQQEHEQNVMII